jgi:hypothetical protein
MNHLQNHDTKPAPFNPAFRKGFGEAVHKAHNIWCEANPDVTREVRKEAYAATCKRLEPSFPTAGELGTAQDFSKPTQWIPA